MVTLTKGERSVGRVAQDLECLHQLVVVVREQVSVAIENDSDAGVTGTCSDLLGMSSRGDPQRNRRVSEIVDTQG